MNFGQLKNDICSPLQAHIIFDKRKRISFSMAHGFPNMTMSAHDMFQGLAMLE
jgi:hypothetical protein